MKTQYIFSEEEYDRIIGIIEGMDADLGSLVNHMDEYDHVKKYARCLRVLLGKLYRSLETEDDYISEEVRERLIQAKKEIAEGKTVFLRDI